MEGDGQRVSVGCRVREYADGKPRPLMRGVLHGLLSLGLLGGAVFSARLFPAICAGLTGKMITYGASALFHLYPFKTVRTVTRAFVVDIALVPFSVCGAGAAFVTSASVVRETCIAGVVVALNLIAVIWQTHGQVGLNTRSDRSDMPRSVIVTMYSIWVLTFVGLSAGFAGMWPPVLALAVLAGLLAGPVGDAHELEPTFGWARWHALGVWSLHEDFHLLLALSDACWLALAAKFQADGRVPVIAV